MRRRLVSVGTAVWTTHRVSSWIAKSGRGWNGTGGARGQGQSGGDSGSLLSLPWILPQRHAGKEDGILHRCRCWVWTYREHVSPTIARDEPPCFILAREKE